MELGVRIALSIVTCDVETGSLEGISRPAFFKKKTENAFFGRTAELAFGSLARGHLSRKAAFGMYCETKLRTIVH